MLRPIDNDGDREEAGGKVNYDESENEKDLDLGNAQTVLPLDEDGDEVDLCSDQVAEILADGPFLA